MNKTLKSKLIFFVSMVTFMIFYMLVFGNKNAVIGITIVMAAFMGLGNDLSFKPKTSFVKVLFLLLVLGIASYFNYPLTIWSCILTFIIVFGTTFTSYHLFSSNVYLPFLMCYFMMVGIPVSLENLPMRLLSLVFGAIFIVGFNIVVNRKKYYKLSEKTISNLVDEINKAIDLKLEGKDVSPDTFKTVNGFYLALYDKFEYKYFPTKAQESILNIVKAFQAIGIGISETDLSKDELIYIKSILERLEEINREDIFEGIDIETEEMYILLLNLEIIVNDMKNTDWDDDTLLPDRKTVLRSIVPVLKNQFSFRSVKFTFAFKMAFMLTIWEILTLIFNLPYTKWLYFVTIALMLPYIDDLEYRAKSRIKGTFAGIFIFAIIIFSMPYIPIPHNTLMMIVMGICMFVMVFKLEDKFILTSATTIMSVMSALMYIELPQAITLKVLWVVVGVIVVSIFNFKFLPYSVEKETENNLKTGFSLNCKFIDFVKQKCNGELLENKSTLLTVSNLVRENIEVTDENKELYDIQIRITEICNFILNYIDIYGVSSGLKNNILDIIENNAHVDDNLEIKDRVIAYSMSYVMGLFDREKELS